MNDIEIGTDFDDVQYLMDLPEKIRNLDKTMTFVREKYVDNLKMIEEIADKLDEMGKDLLDAGVPGYGHSIRSEAKKLRDIIGVIH